MKALAQVGLARPQYIPLFDTDCGGIMTPDGLRAICADLDNDPEKIGIHMLEMLAKFRNEGIVE